MSDFNLNNKVVQANELIQQANWKMNTVPLKLFKTIISCIDTENPKEQVTITKKELANFMDAGENYTYLRTQIKSLQRQIVEIKKEDAIISLSILPKVIWNAKSEDIVCQFDKDIMPYLVELKGMFLQYDVGSLKNFDSKYGVILYEYLLSRERQENATIINNPKHEFYISIENLRRLTGTEDKYPRIEAFKRKVLSNAENDINNANVEFLMKWTAEKKGRKVSGVRFQIRKRTSYAEKEYCNIRYPERAFDKI